MLWTDIVTWSLAGIGGVASVNQLRIWVREWHESRIDRFSSIERHGILLLKQIKRTGFSPDFVLGLGRSGAFLAGWLAGNLGSVRIEVLDRIHKSDPSDPMEFPNAVEKIELWKSIYGNAAKVLIVEGAATRGGTFYHFEKIRKIQASNWLCKFCVLYLVDTANFNVDFCAKKLNKAPLRYPWHKTQEWQDFIRHSQNLNLL